MYELNNKGINQPTLKPFNRTSSRYDNGVLLALIMYVAIKAKPCPFTPLNRFVCDVVGLAIRTDK